MREDTGCQDPCKTHVTMPVEQGPQEEADSGHDDS
jgi:hypothetical protein